MNQVVTELTIDARGATKGSADYVRAMAVAQSAVDRWRDREEKLAAAAGNATDVLMTQSASLGRVAANWDRLRASIDPVAKAELAAARDLDRAMLSADAAVKRGVATQQDAARVVSALRQKQVAELNAVREAAQRANAAQAVTPVAANQNRRLSSGQWQGLSFQANDVVTMALLGAPMSQIAASQAGQVLQLLQQGDGGVKGSLQAIKGQAVDTTKAIAGFLGPLGLIASGFGVAAVAAGAYYLLTREKAKTADELLKQQTETVRELGNAYGDVASKAKQAFGAGNQNSFAIASSMTANGIKLAMTTQTRDLMGEVGRFISPGKSAGGYFGIASEFQPFADAITHLRKTAAEGRPDILGFRRMVEERWALEPNNSALTATAGKLQELSKESTGLAEALRELDLIRRKLFDDVGPNGMLLSRGTTNRDDAGNLALFESQEAVAALRRRAAAEAQLQGMLARSPDQKAAAARAAAAAQYNDSESAAARRDRIDIAGKLALAEAEKGLAEARRERARSLEETLASQQLEISLIGQTVGEVARLRMEYDLTSKLREEAARNGIEADQKEIDLIKQKAAEYGRYADEIARTNLMREVQFEREQMFRSSGDQEIASRLRGAGLPVDLNSDIAKAIRENQRIEQLRAGIRGFFDDFQAGLMQGDSFGKALGNAILNALNKALDNVIDKLLTSITDSLVGGVSGGSGSGVLGAVLGAIGLGGGSGSRAGSDAWGGLRDATSSAAVSRLFAPANDNVAGGGVAGQVWNFFASKGLASHQIAGILGNVKAESAFNPLAVGDGGHAFGLFQHNDRSSALFNAIGGKGNLGNVQSQLNFAWKELQTTESRALSALMNSKDVRGATAAFAGFERPRGFSWQNPEGAHNFSGRLSGAEEALQKFGGTAEKATSGMLRTGAAGNQAAQGLQQTTGSLSGFAQQLQSFMGSAQGGGSSWFKGLSGMFGGVGGAFSFMNSISPLATMDILSGSWGLFHDGGVAGYATRFRAGVDPRVFIGAPRYHNGTPGAGLASDEVPAILRRGEPVFRSFEHARQVVGGGNKVSININNLGGASVSAESREEADGTTAIDIIVDRVVAEKLSRRGTAANNTLRNQFGAREALKRR
ncbi:MAG: hypothetical protein ABS35_15295 [Kaistia sp. SCN 65-12]|nr:MAG: hypothetical protein ABS35_15295 [Kaistia sp. SCN 65-12]